MTEPERKNTRLGELKEQYGVIPPGCDQNQAACGLEKEMKNIVTFKPLVPKWKQVLEALSSEFPNDTDIKNSVDKLNTLRDNSPDFSYVAAQRSITDTEMKIYKAAMGLPGGKKRKTSRRKVKKSRRGRKSRRV